MQMKRTRTRLAVLMDVVFSVFQEKVKTGISRFAQESDIDIYYLGIGNMDPSVPENELKLALLDMLSPEEFDGIIIVSTSLVNVGTVHLLKEKLQSLKPLPMVSIGPSIAGEDRLGFDNRYGITRIMNHLINRHGYRNFAYISGPISNTEAMERFDAYQATLEAAGIPFDENAVFEGNFAASGGYEGVKAIYDERGIRPQAFVCANDQMAIGVWNALSERGISVPREIAVCGYDGEDLAHTLSHRITTLRQSFEQLGYNAAMQLFERLKGKAASQTRLLKGELRIRSSCGCYAFEHRSVANETSEVKYALYNISNMIISHIDLGCPEERSDRIFTKWTEVTVSALESGTSILDLEHILHMCSRACARSADPRIANYFLLTLYSILQEESEHQYFIKDSFFKSVSTKLSRTVDKLHKELIETLDYSRQHSRFAEIAAICNAEKLYIVEFNNYESIGNGAEVKVSTHSPATETYWQPGDHNWFPSEAGSMAVNILAFDNERYGYFLMSADIPYHSVFDYLTTSFSSVSRDLKSHADMQNLRKKLSSEILERQKTELELKEALSMVKQLSIEDPLTDIHNRRGFVALAEQQLRYYRRQKLTFSVLFIDLDGLKGINDRYGHDEGDIAIKAAAEVLSACLRDSDILGRLGGHEFVALMHEGGEYSFPSIEKRIKENCKQKNVQLKKKWKLSMTIGHYCTASDNTETLDELLKKADSVLYENKRRRKGRIR